MDFWTFVDRNSFGLFLLCLFAMMIIAGIIAAETCL